MKVRKPLNIIFLLAFIFACVAASYAEEAEKTEAKEEAPAALVNTSDMRYQRSPLNKLGRGMINTITCLAELPAGIYRVSKEKGEIIGVTLGFAEGMVTSFLRGASGLFDVVTCVIPPYDKPLMQPEYALDSFDKSYQKWNQASGEPSRI